MTEQNETQVCEVCNLTLLPGHPDVTVCQRCAEDDLRCEGSCGREGCPFCDAPKRTIEAR